MLYKTYYDSPIGKLTLVSKDENLCGLWIEGQKYYLGKINESIFENDDIEIFKLAKKWLQRYFNSDKPDFNIPLKPEGSDFRQAVWKILCEIPYGKVVTYRDIAQKIAKQQGKNKMSAQAIGNAVGHNPISIIIPCHRVVGTNGSLVGYAGGIDSKVELLEHENVDMTKLFIPKKK